MRRDHEPPIEATIAYAADRRGEGVAYARLRSGSGHRLMRIPFRVQRYAGLEAREISYAALGAVATALLERGFSRTRFALADEALVRDVNERRDVPPPLVLPYVRLGCSLNRFAEYAVTLAGEDDDLANRARAEVALHTAA